MMATFIVRRIASMMFVLFAISVLVFLIFFATPGRRPGAPDRRPRGDAAELGQVKHEFGLDRPLPDQYVLMMKKLFITRDLTSYVNRGERSCPQIEAATPVTLSLVLGAAVIWWCSASRWGSRRPCSAAPSRPRTDGHRADRDLDAGLLAGRGGRTWSPRAAATTRSSSRGCRRSATCRSRGPGHVVQGCSALDHALDPVHRDLRRVLRSSLIESRTRTTSAPRARRA